ncbi:Pheophorbide oxygenase [Salix suchowensis]|nr:Pheophorbide oxygenase [Salix suchowensis]
MKMATCNVHIMDGHLMGVAPKYLRLCLKALKLVQSSLQELILPDFLQWCPKVTGRKDRAKSLPFKVESGLVVLGLCWIVAPCYYMNKNGILWICSFNMLIAPGKTCLFVCSAQNFFQFTMPWSVWWQMLCRFEQQHAKEAQFRGVLAALAPVRAGSLTL